MSCLCDPRCVAQEPFLACLPPLLTDTHQGLLTCVPLSSQLSGKWFYIGSALRNPEFKQAAQKIQADYFYFTPNLTDDTILVQEYQTT